MKVSIRFGGPAISEVVIRAIAAVEAAVGASEPTPPSTKKILKWIDRRGLTIDVQRESRKTVTVWIGGPRIYSSGQFDLDSGQLIAGESPKNSNCSAEIREGPTIFLCARTAGHMETLTGLLLKLRQEEIQLNTPGQPTVDNSEFDEGDEPLELAANQKRVLTQSRDEPISGLVSRIRRGRLVLQPEFQREFVWSRSKASALLSLS